MVVKAELEQLKTTGDDDAPIVETVSAAAVGALAGAIFCQDTFLQKNNKNQTHFFAKKLLSNASKCGQTAREDLPACPTK